MSANLRVLVADDERPAREYLVNLLRRFRDVDMVATAASGEEALFLIESERPHLVLLDVQMPGGLDGFGVVHLLNEATMPLVAFVTAHEDYAPLAREVGAIDYLLKPVAAEPLARMLRRARQHIMDLRTPTRA